MSEKRIVIREPEGDTIEWLSDDDGNIADGALDAYYEILISRMKERFPDFEIEVEDGSRTEIRVYGVDEDTEYRMEQEDIFYAHQAVMDDIGNDWSWHPDA